MSAHDFYNGRPVRHFEAKGDAVDGLSGPAAEVYHLLIRRYHLQPSDAASQLASALSSAGHSVAPFVGRTRDDFAEWLADIVDQVPASDLLDAALNQRPG